MATGTMKPSQSTSMLYQHFRQQGGQYYTLKVKYVNQSNRFCIIILIGNQNTSSKIVVGRVDFVSTPHFISFNDSSVTYDDSTSTITVNAGSSAWALPTIIYPQGYMALSED